MKLLLDLQGAQSESRLRGIGRHTRSLAKAIVQQDRGHHVSVLLNGMLRQNSEELRTEFTGLMPADHVLTFQGVSPVAEKDPDNDWRMRASELEREAFVARHAPDILHVGSLFEGFLDDAVTSIGALTTNQTTAVTLYDLIPLLNPDKYLVDPTYCQSYLRRAQAMKRADLMLALSESSKREAMDVLNIEDERIAVVHSGVDVRFRPLEMSPMQTELLRLKFKIPRKFVLYVGAVDPRKNLAVLIEAFALLSPECRAAHCLVIAGPLQGVERRMVQVMCARHGMGANDFVFCGHVSDDELIELYNACAIFVFPSTHEGFGLPPLEAMACGAPVLAADCTSLPEVVGRADLLFDPHKPTDLAGRMDGILTDIGMGAELRTWGIARAAEFSWEECARRTLDAFEALHARRSHEPVTRVGLARRPRLAFLSPLPNDQTGVADYSAELLPEIARHYEIECIIHDTHVTDRWIRANYTLRDVGWFKRNFNRYDRVVYSFGNSQYHAWMVELIRKFPGIVVLHDFYLSNLLEWMASSGSHADDTFLRELYVTHGLAAVSTYQTEGAAQAAQRFACNGFIFREATGVIVHSEYAVRQAKQLFGDAIQGSIARVPFLKSSLTRLDRQAARRRLGVSADTFLVCTFGFITEQKHGRTILDAWNGCSLNGDPAASLAFVGAVGDDGYCQKLERSVATRKAVSQVTITGYVSTEVYRDYLAASDIAVQLRQYSRGETSAAILDCFAAGVPVIVNAVGPAAELPLNVVRMLPEMATSGDLSGALEYFHGNRDAAAALGSRGRSHLLEHHHPARAGTAFMDAIEGLSQSTQQSQQQALLSVLAQQHAVRAPTEADFLRLSRCVSHNSQRPGLRQLLCDVTVLAEQDSKTGIQRVVRAVLTMLLEAAPSGFRIEPVRIEGAGYVYARNFTERMFGIPAAVVPDAMVDYAVGDVFLGIDWVPDRLTQVVEWLSDFRSSGGRTVMVVYDLLPLLSKEFFPDFMGTVTQQWFEAVLAVSDQIVCISRTVADDVTRFAEALEDTRVRKLDIDFFHMGSDLSASRPSSGLPDNSEIVLSALKQRRSFLMVGTVEPRKGHLQVVRAFDALWREGVDVGLVIVGKRGWMVDEVAQTIEFHAEYGKKLFWLHNISDEMLDQVYAACAALIAASAGEGFGLPLIEAAKHHLPLVARDLPVFREVAGDHAFYFKGNEAKDVAMAIKAWLDLEKAGKAPSSEAVPCQSWRAAVDELLYTMFDGQPYRTLGSSAQ